MHGGAKLPAAEKPPDKVAKLLEVSMPPAVAKPHEGARTPGAVDLARIHI